MSKSKKSPLRPNKQKYRLQASDQEASYLSILLPCCYSVQLQEEDKRAKSAGGKMEKKPSTVEQESLEDESKIRSSPRIAKLKGQDWGKVLKSQSFESIQEEEPFTMKCFEMLEELKRQKCSWPFLTPVDPVLMGVPEYLEVIKFPMDLRTMQQKLLNGKYRREGQFYADVRRIIKNSYEFNAGNQEYIRPTRAFERAFNSILQKRKSDMNQTDTSVTLKQKMHLSRQILNLQPDQKRALNVAMNGPRSKTTQPIDLESMKCQEIKRVKRFLYHILNQPESEGGSVQSESSFQTSSSEEEE